MPTVPFRRGQQQAQRIPSRAPVPPPDPVYTMMAATQMHNEGRLLADDQSNSDAKLNSIPAAATQAIR